MARIAYVDEHSHPHLAELIQAIREQRRGKLINVYGLLLHSPEIAQAWMQLLNAVRWKTGLSPRLREMIIVRIAALNRLDYVVAVHRATFAAADGLGHDECDALLAPDAAGAFASEERAAIQLADAMTRDVGVPDDVFAEVRRHFTEPQIVELTVLVGAYNMHTRVMRALQIDPD